MSRTVGSVEALHGMVHAEFRQHAMGLVGHARWKALLDEAGLPSQPPRLSQRYPDVDLGAAVGLLAGATNSTASRVLHDFGRALFPTLIAIYGDLVPSAWRALDLIEHTEEVIHRAVRLQDASAAPPRLQSMRVSPAEVRVLYSSARRLCSLAHGLLEGVGAHFDEPLQITQARCVGRDDAVCEFLVASA